MLKKLREVLRRASTPDGANLPHLERRRLLQELLAEGDPAADDALRILVTLSRDQDGFVREEATWRLAKSPAPVALQAIVLRLNDWVYEVRQTARGAAATYLETERLPAVLAALEAIVGLSGKSRTDHSTFVDQVGAFLDRPEHRSLVLARFRKSRGPVASFLLSRMLRWPAAAQAEVVRLSARHADFLVRSRLLSACEASGSLAEAALRALLTDRHPRNRQKAFLALWQRAPSDRQALLEQALLDPSGAVRGVALWAAKQIGFDLAAFVSAQGNGEALAPRTYLGWLQLLGVLKNRGSLPLVEKAFADVRPQVRQAALLAWVAISRETADVPTVQAMLDSSPKVAKLAGQLLRKGKVLLSGEQLQQIGEALERHGDLSRQLAFAQRLAYWEHLAWLLELLPRYRSKPEQQTILRELANSLARQRYALASQPPAMQERLRQAMRQSGLREAWGNHDRLLVSLEEFD
ncbi:hypothetical protein [Azovibrio restrictus]|uniref:hypothetical protein n=1 Tax=Azovibrio restrictus TaxID=146938 RepID=UPI0003F96B66|nr:hypothetical protein [Azovibrio restrictus]